MSVIDFSVIIRMMKNNGNKITLFALVGVDLKIVNSFSKKNFLLKPKFL